MQRSKIIVKSGLVFILINFILAVINVVVGVLSGSIAILSDALHSLIDSVSGFVVVISEKIFGNKKYADKRDKIERITTIIIAIIILMAGVHILIESIEKIITPEEVDYTGWTIAILVLSIILKLLLALYLRRNGKEYKSKVLIASSAETMNDALISVAVLFSVLIYYIWQVDIEAYVSILVCLIIFKIGLEFLFPKISKHHHHLLESDPSHGAEN